MELLNFLNVFNTFLQGVLFAYTAEYWINNKIESKKRVACMALSISVFILSMDIIFRGASLSYFIMHTGIVLVGMIPYSKEDKKKALSSISIVYNTSGIMVLITSVVAFEVLSKVKYPYLAQSIILYLPQFIFTYMVIFKPKVIFDFYKKSFARIKWGAIVIISLYIDYAITFLIKYYAIDTRFFADFTIATFLALIGVTIYFLRQKSNYLIEIDRQKNELEQLNKKFEVLERDFNETFDKFKNSLL